MQVKSLVKIALSIVLTFVLILVTVPSSIASAETINGVKSDLTEFQFNTEKTEIVANSSVRGDSTAVINETLKNIDQNTDCLALAENKDATAIESEVDNNSCKYKNAQCDLCDDNDNCKTVYRFYRINEKGEKECRPCIE